MPGGWGTSADVDPPWQSGNLGVQLKKAHLIGRISASTRSMGRTPRDRKIVSLR